jgi:very-short-patch-repair endonuclease
MKTVLAKPKQKYTKSGVVFLQHVEQTKVEQARVLRQEMTPAEAVIWIELRNRNFHGHKFRRQQIIDGYIVDFYCEQAKLVVEIDGSVHDTTEQQIYDEHRNKVFNAKGISVVRFSNDDVLFKIDSVLDKLQKILNGLIPSPGGEGWPKAGVRSTNKFDLIPRPLLRQEKGHKKGNELLTISTGGL